MILSTSLALLCLGSFSRAAQDIDGDPVLVLGDVVPIDSPDTWYSDLHPCPAPCLNNEPSNWTLYSTVERLSLCAEPMLLDFAIFNPLDDKDTTVKLRACTTAEGNADTSVNALFENNPHQRRSDNGTAAALFEIQKGALSDAAITALQQLARRGSSTLFTAYNGTFAGAYVGSAFEKSAVAMVAAKLVRENSVIAQLCGGRNTNHLMGVAVGSNLAEVQRSVASWAEAKCVAGQFSKISIPLEEKADLKVVFPRILPRADCVTTNVIAGDTCAALATRCGITAATFTQYNPSSNLCSTLQPGQRVCCSAGTVPDIRPRPNADGSCSSYTVKSGDTCASIASRLGLTAAQLALFNDGVSWGWNGCNNLAIDINICLSTGKPPMPAPIANAICGPTKPGTKPPQGTTKMEDLNPCPLKACCNIWGQCGVTKDFCLVKKGPFNNPGTAPPGTNGCISSCGTDIVKGATAPASYGRVGYYESWNMGRPCATMKAQHANTDGSYTIMHWAFMEINTADWTVKLKDDYNQWEGFQQLKMKKVISFGGWAFSNEMPTYDILRQAMSPNNRAAFAANCIKFMTDQRLDGLDFDWEYPGATDIPTTPNGSPADGVNYYLFLSELKSKMPAGKTISIAAPSSYWYLKNFPIKLMSDVLDYIVYMTYDLHGQWDAGNQWAMDGCPTGNCLRSHVNITEVEASLSMVTKAGVPASKIFVGETSYGRSFRMARSGCTGPMCQFLGTNTTPRAKAGRCTGQGGIISNFEIDEIIAKGGAQSWHDAASNTDMLVYDTTEWVSYMTSMTKETRRQHWKGFNLGGTIDWAVDLQTSANSDGGSGGWPKVTNGQCKGSDCISGKCVGPACISIGCDGPGCIGGLCTTPDCTPMACADRDCENGACTGSICKTRGCSGLDCGLDGKCIGSKCISLGCSGKNCALDTGICSGTDCAKTACGGDSCQNGVCLRGSAACQGLGMQPWPTSTAGRCNGPDCVGGLCIGIRCVSFGCLNSNSCVNGVCLDSSCTATACIGPGCIEGVCVKPGCKSTGCVGTDCDASGHCNGADCVAIGCAGNDCNEATGLCLGPSCTKQSCAGPDCTRGDCRGDHECVPFAGCAGDSCGGGTITTITTTESNGQSTTYIATLVPTTTTDAAGHIITGTITNGPSTTQTDDPALITYTEFPLGITAISTSVTHNTHDNDGNPILGPWPLCWFCPPGSHGWKLPGFRPGVYPPGGPPTPMPLKFPTITIKPNGDPEYKRSECQTATVTDVTSWVEVVVDGSQTVTATSAYSTDSSTVKACSATPRTTKKYTTTVAHYCEPTSCGSACAAARKREVVFSDSSELEYMPALEYNSEASNVGLYKRREESPGRGDWGAWYRRLRDEVETDTIENDTEDEDAPTAFRNVMWGGDTRQSILVQQLTGCFALFCVSTKGAFVAHFWEKPSLREGPPPAISSRFETDVVQIIKANVADNKGPIQPQFDPSCHLMVGTRAGINSNSESDQATLISDSEEPNRDLSAARDKIVTQLKNLLPGFPVKVHTYKKQVRGEFQMDYGYGKAAVIYDNGLGDNTETTVSVYLQGLRVRLMNIPNPGPAIPGSEPTSPAESGSPTTPTATPDPPTSPPVTNKPYYDCEGDPFCGMMPVKWCDKAVNNMERGSKMYTSDESIAKSGNCWANSEGHGCKVTVRGPDKDGYVCGVTGDDLWGYYQDIRKIGGCGRCGTVHIGNGCMISVDVHHGCANRDSGLLSLSEEF